MKNQKNFWSAVTPDFNNSLEILQFGLGTIVVIPILDISILMATLMNKIMGTPSSDAVFTFFFSITCFISLEQNQKFYLHKKKFHTGGNSVWNTGVYSSFANYNPYIHSK